MGRWRRCCCRSCWRAARWRRWRRCWCRSCWSVHGADRDVEAAAGEAAHHRAAEADVAETGEGRVEEGLASGGVVAEVEVDAADRGLARRGAEAGADHERERGRDREHPNPPEDSRPVETGRVLGGHRDLSLPDRVGRRPSGRSRSYGARLPSRRPSPCVRQPIRAPGPITISFSVRKTARYDRLSVVP